MTVTEHRDNTQPVTAGTRRPSSGRLAALALVVALLGAGAFAFWPFTSTPHPLPTDAPADGFSAAPGDGRPACGHLPAPADGFGGA